MRIIVIALLFLSVTLASVAHEPSSAEASILFKENKGQWEKQILYKSELVNGAVFFESGSITFNLFDRRDMQRILGDHHRLGTYSPVIDYTMHFHAFKMKLPARQTAVTGSEPVSEYFNYFIGNDPASWASGVNAYQKLRYKNLLEGVDLEIQTEGGTLKYVYEVSAGADVRMLQVNFEGIDRLSVNDNGDLVMTTSLGDILDLKPFAFQILNGKKSEVVCRYEVNGTTVSYVFPQGYDRKQMLYIDPTLVFSTYSGSTADNFGYSATYDSKGNAFAAGSVFGTGYPVTVGAYRMNYVGGPTIVFTGGGTYPGADMAITKYSADGSQRIYSTYLGGYGQDLPHSLIANPADELYILGTTGCTDYPTTTNAYDRSYNGGTDPGVFDGIAAHYRNGSDIVISKLSMDGTQLLASTYVGGSGNDGLNYRAGQPYSSPGFLRHNYADEVRGEIEIDLNDNVYVASCTRSANFPRTQGTFQNNFGGGQDACIFKMDANLNTMIWSTTFGGNDDDAAYSVSLDREDNLYVAGGTRSVNFIATSGSIQTSFGGGEADGFVSHIDKNGQAIIQSTYFGFGDYDQIYFVDLDKSNNVYVYGQTDNSDTNFIRNALYNKPNGGQFISKLNPTLDTLVWSTSFGRGSGRTDISPTAFLVDVCNNVYACGWGSPGVNNIVGGTGGTIGLDVTPDALKQTTDGQDFYLMVMRDDASALTYATFLGGNISEEHVDGGTSRFDRKGVVYQSVCAGCGGNSDFPTTPGAVSRTNRSSNCNNAVFKFDLNLPICLADFSAPNACRNIPVSFANNSKSAQSPSYQWYFGDGNISTSTQPTHTYSQSGVFDVTLIITDPGSCNFSDTITKKILVIGGDTTGILPSITICSAQTVQIGIPPSADTSFVYQWSPANTLSSESVSNPVASPTQTTTYRLLVGNGVCVDTFFQTVFIFNDKLVFETDDIACPLDTVRIRVTNTQAGEVLFFRWRPIDQIVSGANTATPLVSPSQTTTFVVIATTQSGCTITDSVTVQVLYPDPTVNATATPETIQFGDSSQLNLAFSSDVVTYRWLPDNTLSADNITNPLAFPRSTHTYYAEVENEYGCRNFDSVTVFLIYPPCDDSQIFIPSAFSPNGDGKNDVLYVRSNLITTLYFAIYDRWGQNVFETKDISKGWDGTFNGKKLDPAVFGYYAEGDCEGGQRFVLKGNVTLLR